MKYYIIAGEASGDLHASNLVRELKKLDSEAEVHGWGGDMMQEQGVNIVKHYRDLAFMGFIEVIANLRTILQNIRFCKEDILNFNPDIIILVDYPGFNLRIASFAKLKGFKVFYYISPQIWAWKQSRVHQIKKHVDKMFVILPFEEKFYKDFDYKVDFVGHPLLDAIVQRKSDKQEFREKNHLEAKPIVALLPGSRQQEIATMLPLMLSVKKDFPDYEFVVGAAPSVHESFYEKVINDKSVKVVSGQTYDLLEHSEAALVTSGTATLETALFEVPEVVCYKGNKLSYLIARSLVKVDFISLVNLIMGKEIVKELIQDELNKQNLKMELEKLLYNDEYRIQIKGNYKILKEKLGGSGASAETAKLMWNYLN
ncbi:MAG: lipid-A-disaccharide synthase [Bacteroidia bacterium]